MNITARHVVVALLYILSGFLACMGSLALVSFDLFTEASIFYIFTMLFIGVGALLQRDR